MRKYHKDFYRTRVLGRKPDPQCSHEWLIYRGFNTDNRQICPYCLGERIGENSLP